MGWLGSWAVLVCESWKWGVVLTIGWEINEEDGEGLTAGGNSGACTSRVREGGYAGRGIETVRTGENQETAGG